MYGRICVIWHLFNSNNCAISADLAQVCALLSAILVYIKANSGFVIKTFLCYPANKQTNADENITSSTEVIIQGIVQLIWDR